MKRTRPTRDAAATTDGLVNLVARLGQGASNAFSQATYRSTGLTRNQQRLEQMYTSSWIVRAVVDALAEDMTRAGIVIAGTQRAEEVQAELTRRGVWPKLTEGLQWGRLYGGAISIIMINGQDVSTPLNLDTVTKGSFSGLKVVDRWGVTPSTNLNGLQDATSPDLPEFYTYNRGGNGQRIHHTRVLRHEGDPLPWDRRIAEEGWGASVMECMDDRITAFDSVTMGVANLVFKAHLRTISIKDYRNVLAQGGRSEEALLKSLKLMQVLQTNEGLTIMDAEDKFEAHSYSFGGLGDVILQFGQQLAGASGIPLVRLFGQSPSGLNSTGDGDIRNYYDRVNTKQESSLRSPMERILQVAYRSALGRAPEPEMSFAFTPLWQMSETEKGELGKTVADAVVALVGADILTPAQGMREMQRSGMQTGLGATITDEEIREREDEPPLPAVEGTPPEGDEPADPSRPVVDGWRKYFRRRG